MFVPFGEWLPDQPNFEHPGSPDVRNLVPIVGGYRPLPTLEPFNLFGFDEAGASPVFVDSKIIKTSTGEFVSTQLTTARFVYRRRGVSAEHRLTANSSRNQRLVDFKNEIFVVDGTSSLQHWNQDGSSGDALNIIAGSPIAKVGASVRDFLVLGNISGYRNRIFWSGYNNFTQWDTAISNQSGYLDMPSQYGEVTAIIGGEFGYVFQERAIHKLTYVGSPIIFRIDLVARDLGTRFSNAAKVINNEVYFYSDEGFFKLAGDGSISNIGANKVNAFIAERIHGEGQLQYHINDADKYFLFCFTSKDNNDKTGLDICVLYAWEVDRFAEVVYSRSFTHIGDVTSPGYSLEDLDTLFPGGIDVNSVSVDAELNPTDKVSLFFSSAGEILCPCTPQSITDNQFLVSTLSTPVFALKENISRFTRALVISPHATTAGPTLKIRHSRILGETMSEQTLVYDIVSRRHLAPNVKNRYFQFVLHPEAGNANINIKGVDAELKPAGKK